LRDTTQVARRTKKAVMALIGNSLWRVETETLRLSEGCNARIKGSGRTKAIPPQMSKRLRSVRPHVRGCSECAASSRSEPSRGAFSFCDSFVGSGPGSFGKVASPVGMYDCASQAGNV